MIINASRMQFFLKCRRLQYFYDQRLVQLGLTQPLSMGSAYHKGAAILVATKNRANAITAAETEYRNAMKEAFILPEEKPIHERNIELVKRMVNAQADQYTRETWTVLMPEVEFCVDIPGTRHHCGYIHRILYPEDCERPGTIGELAIRMGSSGMGRCPDERCYVAHKLRGRSDGILNWNSLIWILERKTSGMKQHIWWDQWYLSHQISAYIWGVRKATGLPVHGVLVEKSPKPAKNQDPFSFDYSPEREPYIRSEADLGEFQDEISRVARDYETAAFDADPFREFYRNPLSCTSYNRRCDFWDTCKRNGEVQPGQYRLRQRDYVELEYYKMLNMEPPVVMGDELKTEVLEREDNQ